MGEKTNENVGDPNNQPYSLALNLVREAHMNLLHAIWNTEPSALFLSASLHAVHASMFSMERLFIESVTSARAKDNGEKRDA